MSIDQEAPTESAQLANAGMPGDIGRIEPELTHLRAAAEHVASTQRVFVDAVTAARASGYAWSSIGFAMGASTQTAREFYEQCRTGLAARR